MSVIAPKFRLGYLIKGLTDNIFWIIVILTLGLASIGVNIKIFKLIFPC